MSNPQLKNKIAQEVLNIFDRASQWLGGVSLSTGLGAAVFCATQANDSGNKWLTAIVGGGAVMSGIFACFWPAFAVSMKEPYQRLENEVAKGLVKIRSSKKGLKKEWFIYDAEMPDSPVQIVKGNIWTNGGLRKLEVMSLQAAA